MKGGTKTEEGDMDKLETIKNLLQELSDQNPEIYWQLKCTFCDGIKTTIYEVALYEIPGYKFKGRLSFQLESNKIIRCNYKDFDSNLSEDIVDTLLDLINFEKQLHSLNLSLPTINKLSNYGKSRSGNRSKIRRGH